MVTRTTEPSPGTRNSRVRPTGQRSPRSRSRYTPYRYSAADSSRTSARNGSSRPCDTSDTPVNGGRADTVPGAAIPAGYAGPGRTVPAPSADTDRKWPPRRMWIGLAGNNDRVTSASAIEKGRIHSLTRPNMVSVGTIVWLSSELMFFAALFAMYFSIRAAAGPAFWKEHTDHLNLYYATPVTLILVSSSVTCQLGVFAAEKGDVF